ncbi:hypothetical protein IJL65_02255 [bacterium]|nr:hypothetical protein [bacterium]
MVSSQRNERKNIDTEEINYESEEITNDNPDEITSEIENETIDGESID